MINLQHQAPATNIINLNHMGQQINTTNQSNGNSEHTQQSIQLINSNNCRLETITISNYGHGNETATHNGILMSNNESSNGLHSDDLLLTGK